MHSGACTLEGAGGLTTHGTCVVVFLFAESMEEGVS